MSEYLFRTPRLLSEMAGERAVERRELMRKMRATRALRRAEQLADAHQKDEERAARKRIEARYNAERARIEARYDAAFADMFGGSPDTARHEHVADAFQGLLNSLSGRA